jgi:hypothetical protein
MPVYTYENPVTTNTRTRPLYRGTQVIWYILGVLEALLAFRFVLRLLAANPSAGFTSFIYTLSYPFAAPFLAVFNTSHLASSAFEWTTLLAMLVYWMVALGILKLFTMSKPVSRTEAAVKLDQQA